MPTYVYEALNSAGKPQKGTVEATSSEEAIQQIKRQGYFPTSVREQKVKTGVAGRAAKVKKAKKKGGGMTIAIGGVGAKKVTTFTRQLSTLQDAGPNDVSKQLPRDAGGPAARGRQPPRRLFGEGERGPQEGLHRRVREPIQRQARLATDHRHEVGASLALPRGEPRGHVVPNQDPAVHQRVDLAELRRFHELQGLMDRVRVPHQSSFRLGHRRAAERVVDRGGVTTGSKRVGL